jgi:hypothetical protein
VFAFDRLIAPFRRTGIGVRLLDVGVLADENALGLMGIEPQAHIELPRHFGQWHTQGVPSLLSSLDPGIGAGHVLDDLLVGVEQVDVEVLGRRLRIAVAAAVQIYGHHVRRFLGPRESRAEVGAAVALNPL